MCVCRPRPYVCVCGDEPACSLHCLHSTPLCVTATIVWVITPPLADTGLGTLLFICLFIMRLVGPKRQSKGDINQCWLTRRHAVWLMAARQGCPCDVPVTEPVIGQGGRGEGGGGVCLSAAGKFIKVDGWWREAANHSVMSIWGRVSIGRRQAFHLLVIHGHPVLCVACLQQPHTLTQPVSQSHSQSVCYCMLSH